MNEVATEKRRHVLSLLITGTGLVLFWRGVWDLSEKVFSSEVSLIIGLSMLVSVALIEKRQLFKFLS
jgi:hypothetical protein